MPRSGGRAAYTVVPDERLTVDVYGADGTKLRIVGVLDSAPDGAGYGGPKTRLVLTGAVARALED